MKHLLDIKYFLTEALTPEFKEKYRKHFDNRSKEVQARLNNLLDNQERVYIPFVSDTISETQLKVKSYLEDQGYTILDYKLNSAVQIENSKRTIRISKLLAKEPALLKEFTLDDTRANTRVGSEFSIVLTSNYEDVAGMSFERCWTNSCLDIKNGGNKRYVQDEVQQGTVVAYLIKSDDPDIEAPLGRVNVKPYYNLRDENEVIYVLDHTVYGNVPDEKLFKKIITSYLKEKQEVKIGGFFEKVDGLYSDEGSPNSVLIRKDYTVCYDCLYDEEGFDKEGFDRWEFNREGFDRWGFDRGGFDKEGFDRGGISKNGDYTYGEHLTKEQYGWLKQNIKSKFHLDENGFVNVDGDVNISNQGLTEIPVKFGVVEGWFNCSFNKLTTLVGAPSIVEGVFSCSNNPNLTSLIDGPIVVGGFYCSFNKLTSLIGVPSIIGEGGFSCSNNNLTSLVGAPSIVGGDFSCTFNPNLTSLVGAPQEVKGNFSCSNNNLTSLVGAPKGVKGYFSCYNQKNGHRFTKEDVLKVSQVGQAISV